MLGTKPMSRHATVIGATLLSAGFVLSGCGNPSPSPTGDSSIIVTPQTPEPTSSTGALASEGSAPDLSGFELIFSAHYEHSQTPHVDPSPQAEPGRQPKPGTQTEGSTPEKTGSGSSTAPTNTITSTGPAFDGVLVSEDYVAVYSNNLSEQTYEITGYSVSSGSKDWSHEGDGILSCDDGGVVVCETKSYTDGVWTTAGVWLFSIDVGGFQALDIGDAGTYSYVGDDDGNVYFLTWDGTRSVHMTGFDESGVPVVDKNLKVSAPTASENLDLETWMNGSHAVINFPGEAPILYDASTNLFAEVDVAAPCISLKDGAVCTSSQDPATVVGIDDRVRESWRHTTTAVSLLDATSKAVSLDDFKDLFLISQPPVTQIPEPGIEPGPGHPVPGKTAAATPGAGSVQLVVASVDDGAEREDESLLSMVGSRKSLSLRGFDATSGITVSAGDKPGADPSPQPESLQSESEGDFPLGLDRLYATVAGKDAVLLPLAEKTLSLPTHRAVSLGDQAVESVDLSRKTAIVNVSAADPSAGESGSTRVLSSLLVGEDGTVLSSLSSARISELFSQAAAAGQQITAHTFAWKGDYLVFSDASQGVVALYKQK